jgi:hypothetical protein
MSITVILVVINGLVFGGMMEGVIVSTFESLNKCAMLLLHIQTTDTLNLANDQLEAKILIHLL